MKTIRIILCLQICGLLSLCLPSYAAPELTESKKMAYEGRRAWSLFEAAALAASAGNQKLHEEFFEAGVKSGRAFLAAAKSDKITREDANHTVPLIVFLVAQGPSNDFILGRIYAAAEQSADEKIKKDGKTIADKELHTLAAETELRRMNADLLLVP